MTVSMSELLGDPWPRIRASSISKFLDSPEGNNFIRVVNQYVFVNHTCRSKYSEILLEIRREIVKGIDRPFGHMFEQEHDREMMLRLLETEIVCSAYMASEDFATFCLAFREALEDLPSAVTRTSPRDIWKFYKAAGSASQRYFQRLWVYEESSAFLVDEYERELIETVQQQNIQFLSYLMKQLAKFRGFYSTLYNKYKHGFPLFFLGGKNAGSKICSECQDLILVASEEADPLGKPRAFILGEHAINLAMRLHSISMHALEALLRSRLNWLRFNGWRNPPTVVYGHNPLGREDWDIYQRTVRLMVPEPVKRWPLKAKIAPRDTSVAKLYSWIHSDEAETHWLTAVPERFFFFRE